MHYYCFRVCPAFPQVDHELHKLSIQAKDYVGCDYANAGANAFKKKIIIIQAVSVAAGSSWP